MGSRVTLIFLLMAFAISPPASRAVRLPAIRTNADDIHAFAAKRESPNQKQIDKAPPRTSDRNAKPELKEETLTGIVEWEYKPVSWDCDVPNCDHFALYDDASRNNYELDDARAALPYEGRRVKVTGVLNPKTATIHVLSIEALKKAPIPAHSSN